MYCHVSPPSDGNVSYRQPVLLVGTESGLRVSGHSDHLRLFRSLLILNVANMIINDDVRASFSLRASFLRAINYSPHYIVST